MKTSLLILMFAFMLGCVQSPPMPPKPLLKGYGRQSEAIIQPPPPSGCLLVWNPGGYTNFVLVDTTNIYLPLSQWEVFTNTTETNVAVVFDAPARFFTLYGTNADGNSDWVTK